ncbi:hypothetical protein GCM10017608_34860 [Agromyces luteolus]|uniref:Uncharacterized protein n=1 Tax=Agromyces luteolus TaxID=88373 RepID=A0A7C9MHT7_9MICO|nr:hypothetical protein [Agromyces luteolus]MUN07398.1 hypothetical protein [Agromyces luteolus]GLK29548.1 hypothetical protein GCM10017608_34860 [Agromyces luteolus]
MATVADIEPASLTITPGTAEQFTLTLRNEGDDVEAYRLTAIDDAAEHVVIEPDTLLLHPGESGTATATMRLEHTGSWAVGEMVVRFQVVPAGAPDDFLVLEAIATIQSFSDVSAVLSPPSLEGRRGATTRIAVSNNGNAHADADLAVSAGNLELTIDRPRVALPAGSTQEVSLRVHARSLLWRGDPEQHDFTVSVSPENQPSATLEGTFRQLPLLPGWTFIAAIVAAAVIGLALIIGLAVLLWNSLTGAAPVATTEPPTETPTVTAAAEPVSVVTELTAPADPDPADGTVVATVAVDAADAPEDSLVAVAVSWPDQLALAGDSCIGWLDGATDELQEPGAPGLVRPGDQCLIDPGALRSQADLEFTLPPEGFSGTVSAKPSRLVSVEDGTVAEVDPGIRTSSAERLEVALDPPPFWMQVEAYRPNPESSTRQYVMAVHRTLDADSDDAQFAFRITAPDFAQPPNLFGAFLQNGAGACISVPEEDVCVVDFPVDVPPAEQGSGRWVGGTLETQWVFVPIQVPTDESAAGLVSLEAVGITEGDDELGEGEVADLVPPATGPLVVGSDVFPVDVEFDPSSAPAGEEVQATVELTAAIFDDRSAAEDGSRLIQVKFDWTDRIDLVDDPIGCATYDARERVCTLDEPADGELPDIELTFSIDDDATFDGTDHADLLAKASVLTYPPEDEEDLTGGADVPGGWPIRWDATEIQPLDFEFG